MIAILSYKRAKSSIFQPNRSEVTRIQTDILVDFLKSFIQNGNSIDKAIDYSTIFRYNINLALRNFDLSEQLDFESEKYQEMNTNLAGWYERMDQGVHQLIFFEGNLEAFDQVIFHKNQDHFVQTNKKKLRERNPNIKRIFITKKHKAFVDKLRDISDNPFLSKELQSAADQIGNNLVKNIHFTLRKVIEELLLEVYEAYVNQDSNYYEEVVKNYNYSRFWEKFEKERVYHKEDYELLNDKIRKHLMIDEKW